MKGPIPPTICHVNKHIARRKLQPKQPPSIDNEKWSINWIKILSEGPHVTFNGSLPVSPITTTL
jgi:hypothetical protein